MNSRPLPPFMTSALASRVSRRSERSARRGAGRRAAISGLPRCALRVDAGGAREDGRRVHDQ
eukprot:4317968-Pyramimonas_sp.AAC.1